MANHRPKSLSELNNVYDKAMRAERAIKEGSDMLSIPETPDTPESEDIFTQLETKAAEAQKGQIFDPDITNIANDFLKRYAQPEKPKPAPQEIKRPAPSIRSVYHTPVKDTQTVKHDIPLSMGTGLSSEVKPQSAPVHKPSHTIPSTEAIKPEEQAPDQEAPTAQPTVIYQAPESQVPVSVSAEPAAAKPAKAPEVKEPAARQTSLKSGSQPAVDHTPRPAPSRVRITSTERSELMEEYLRVMSDEDDEPSYKKPRFSFFKKKKKHGEAEETEDQASLYEEIPEKEDSAEEAGAVPFDSSEVKYTDEYSDAPEEDQDTMNLYDYIAADFDYEEESEDDALDMSFTETDETPAEEADEPIAEKEEIIYSEEAVTEETAEEMYIAEETPETYEETAEYVEAPVEISEETEASAADGEYPQVSAEENAENTGEEVIYPAETDIEEAEVTVTPEEEAVYEEDPTAGMVFEDIFSVSDESKRSHTGGNWSEVLDEQAQEETPVQEEVSETEQAVYAEYAEDESAEAEEVYEEVTEEAEATENTDNTEEPEEDYEAPKKRTFLKILMALATVLCLAGAGISVFLSGIIGVDSGKIFSERYRAFSVDENIESLGLSKGDLVITENTYAQADQLYVYTDPNDGTHDFGRVNAVTTSVTGDYLYITQNKDSVILVNRDTSLGVITATYGGIGSIASAICDYGIFIAVAFVIFAIALIICLVILTRKQRRYEEAAAIYDNPDNFDNDSNEGGDNPSGGGDDDSEYYSDYDTDGIEQGLFVSI